MSHRVLHYMMAFLMSMFIALGMLAVPLLATHMGASDLELGIIGSAAAGIYAVVVISMGALSDRLGRERVIITGALLTGLSYALMPLSRAPIHLILLMLVCGFGMASFWPVLEAWMTEEGGSEEIRKELGAFNVSWSVGGAIGPLFAGFIYTLSSALTFVCAAAGMLVVAVLAAFHKKPDAVSSVTGGALDQTPAEPLEEPVSRAVLYSAWIANFASWFVVSEIRVLFPKLGLDLGMRPWMIGAILSGLGIALTITFGIMGASERWHNKAAPLLFSQALIASLTLAAAAVDSPLAFGLLFFGLGLGFGVTYSYSLYCSVVGSLNKGEASGRHEMALGIGALLGPLVGGFAAEMFHAPRAPYLLAAGVVAAALVAEAIILLLWKTQEDA